MNFNFKNLSENTKRIRIIPKNGTELSANIGVDNPTAMIDEDGVFSVCLSPNETPTISCDGATDYVDFTILLRDGADPNILDTEMLIMIDGETLSPFTPPPEWLGVGEGEPNPYGVPSGFTEVYTLRYSNRGDVNRRLEFKSLSEDMKVFTYNNPTSIQLSDDNSHAGACLSGIVPISCVDSPDRVNFYVTRIGQGGNTTFYLEYKTPAGDIITEDDLISRGVDVSISEDGFSTSFVNFGNSIQFIVTLVQEGDKEFVLSHDYSGNATILEEGVSYGICLRQQY